MLRLGLFLIGISCVGTGFGQTSDPEAVAPVVYSGTPVASPECSRGNDTNACGASAGDQAAEDDGEDTWNDDDDVAYDAPIYDDVYAGFYPGVSLLPVGYWEPEFYWGWGWPYYATYGFGWPYYGFAGYGCCGPYFGFSWSWYWGGHHHHHGGSWAWHDHHQPWRPYHGPYRYYGHGRYADEFRPASPRLGARADQRFARSMPDRAPIASRVNPRGAAISAIGPSRPGAAVNRASLASASYYAFAQRNGFTGRGTAVNRPATNVSRQPNTMARESGTHAATNGHALAARDSRYWVTSLPSRNFAHASGGYAPSTDHRYNSGYAPTSHSYRPHNYNAAGAYQAPPRSAQPRYTAPSGISSAPPAGARGAGSSGYSAHAGGGSTSHSSGGSSHASSSSKPSR